MANCAALLIVGLLSAHHRKTCPWNGPEVGRGVALQALQVDVAVLQHVYIRPSVRDVARRASFNLHGSVFEYEWTLLIFVAFETGEIAGVRSSYLPRHPV